MSLYRNRLLWSVSAGHFSVDLYANILPVAFPLLMASLSLSYTGVAFVATMYTMGSSLSQPFFGLLADRFGGRLLAPLGLVWISVFMGMIGFAPDYLTLLAVALLAGLGSGAFHPQGAMNASLIAGTRKGVAMSIFMFGGNLGFAIGPVVGAKLINSPLGLQGIAFLVIPAVLVAIWLYQAMGAVEQHRKSISSDASRRTVGVQVPVVGVASLIALIMLRSWAQGGISSFVPLLYKDRGISLELSSQVLFVMLVGLAVGAVIGGYLSDIVGRKKVTFVSLALLTPVIFVFLQTVPPVSFFLGFPLGLLFGATFVTTLVMVQELMPKSLGVASGLVLGLGFITGGIGVSITGSMADNFGLSSALGFLALMPIIGALLVLNYKPMPKTAVQT